MTFVQALELLKNRPPTNLSSEELHGLKQFVGENPSLWSVAGGRETVERYLSEAEKAIGLAAHSVDGTSDVAIVEDAVVSSGNRGIVPGVAAILLVLVAVGGFYGWSQLNRNDQKQKSQSEGRPSGFSPEEQTDFTSPETRQQFQSNRKQSSPAPQSQTVAQPSADPSGAQPGTATSDPSATETGPTWLGWTLTLGDNARYEQQTKWDLTDPAQPRPQNLLTIIGGGSTLSAAQDINDRNWLRIVVAEAAPEGNAGQIEVSAAGQPVARLTLRKPGAYLVPLAYLRGRKVNLEIAHQPSNPASRIVWDSVSLVPTQSAVTWTVLTPDRVESANGANLEAAPDGSIFAKGPNKVAEQYFVTATIPDMEVRAVRLEALTDASLPQGGPGRGPKGEFSLASFSASVTQSDERRDRLPGRYVRIELPGDNRQLILSEVEVFAGGKNIALGKSTAQSSVARGAFSERAVDGNANGKFDPYRPTTVMHTSPSKTNPCWWEVDLGQEELIERIVFYNGQPAQPTFTANHRLVVMDMHREVVWQQLNPQAAHPSISYGPFITSKMPVEFRTAIERTLSTKAERPELVRPGTAPTSGAVAEPCDFYFPLDRFDGDQGKLRISGRQITFRIHHGGPPQQDKEAANAPPNLGRFRISVTPDLVSASPEPPMEIVSLLPEAAKLAGKAPQDAIVNKAPPASVAAGKAADQAAPQQRALNTLPSGYIWQGWNIEAEAGAVASPHFPWDPSLSDDPKLETRFTTGGRAVRLVQSRQIDAATAWLDLLAGYTETSAPPGKIEVRIDGRAIAWFEANLFEESPRRLVSLEPYVGKQVKLELVHLPGHEKETVDWDIPTFVANPQAAGFVEWKPLDVEVSARFNSQFKVLADKSVLAVGDNPPGDTYLVKAKLPDMPVTAVRLEVLPHETLPMYGPGRGDRGSFNVGKFSAELVDPNRKPESRTGRFVRLELAGQGRSLTMAELEVFSGGKNVALRKPAQQSTVMFGGTADNAVDGQIGNGSNAKGVGFAHTDGNAPLTWWEVDLGQEYPIERLVVWNRQWSGNEFINYKLAILNSQRGVVWEHVEPDFPVPSAAFEFPHAPRPIRFDAADVTFDDRIRFTTPPNPEVILRPVLDQGVIGWHVGDVPGRMQVATFTVAAGQDLAGQDVMFLLGQYTPLFHNLGRFRLSVTSAQAPRRAQRPVVIEPILK